MQWQIFYPIRKTLGFTNLSKHFQIPDTLSNGGLELMCINDARKTTRHVLVVVMLHVASLRPV